MKRIAVVGLGQIGGSIVLSLRKKQNPYSITGIDTSSRRLKLLQLDRASRDWKDARDADLTILCLHYKVTEAFLRQADPGKLLMDVCSGKAKLVRLANRMKLRFIGGHPMAGNEFAGEKGWRENLFEKAPFFLCPTKQTSKQDLNIVQSLVAELGGRPMLVDAKDHDRFVSVTSHFPAILAGFLSKMAENVPADFQGPGFRSMTRLANTSPDLLRTFLETNGDNILRSAKQMRKLLDRWLKENEI